MEQITITSAKYVNDRVISQVVCIKATIDGIEMSVPLDSANRHYAEIMRQVEAGDLVIQDADS